MAKHRITCNISRAHKDFGNLHIMRCNTSEMYVDIDFLNLKTLLHKKD